MQDGNDPLARPIPPGAVGPGSQPSGPDGAELTYLAMPGAMHTYRQPVLPEPEDAAACAAGLAALRTLQLHLSHHRVGALPQVIDLGSLPAADRRLVVDSLGEGEVSIRCRAADATVLATGSLSAESMADVEAQETRLAGVWRVRAGVGDGPGRDVLEVADVPGFVRAHAFVAAGEDLVLPEPLPAGVMNAPGVLAELLEQVRGRADQGAHRAPGGAQTQADAAAVSPHVVNLTLLPQSEQDLALLGDLLGRGPVSMLSRGYGNCRVTATALREVWWVQYFNSDDTLILNTLEVTPVPAAVLAAQEDLADSAARLAEILAALTEAAA
ncbi:hydrogenase expression/formation C-terminal domain-containing protein [uncultured Thiohalocapsa sp.]|uniref:hydrogenase expression/formation protein n=1 Tax=uncultured Thiohalocapsa sp. TaxID=768990 RepID=UPI0025D8F5D5|nr:hydrogenase expression/formation C-terminal domain-containing protein [uncultured Thiohalocapsa sp.]